MKAWEREDAGMEVAIAGGHGKIALLLGGILVIVGTIEAVVSPRLVKRSMAPSSEK